MSAALLLGIAGLAALDSVNPATIVAVALILMASRDRPVLEAAAFVAGAFATVLVVGAAVYLGAEQASAALDDGLVWLRRAAFGLAAVLVLVSALRRLRPRRRGAVGLPPWFGPWTAAPLGVVMTGADLPNAFPYLVAIERLVDAQVSTGAALLVLTAYAAVYCVPCLVLLALGSRAGGGRVRERLRRLQERYGAAADLPAQPRSAALLAALAVGLGWVAVSA